ncbi:NAD(P)/FAD-dependent oxidoreductase [uncultured Fusobacterium sp.]|uniref:NAD(P)/FAD-dependent oxidoreductase n=1 Tax=uncultured Fusobacterium sp. TaxID=159267 RepID=UPI0025CE1C43|nr:NAD(P)/FAD-dependent oxidoreductase [uncultured Fusobacterium sp.]
MSEKIYDVIIVGGGPAGLTAALYAGRGRLSTLVIEKSGQGSLYMAHKIDNYPGFPEGITGTDLNLLMKKQAEKFGAEFVEGTLLGFDPYEEIKIVKTDAGNFKGKNIIVATGTGKNFGKKIKGEKELLGKGVSYCATCDGAFTKFMTVSLIGQGEELAEEALFLTKFSKVIRVMVTEEEFKCSKESYEALKNSEKVEIITGVKLLEIKGKEYVEELVVEEKGEEKIYKSDFAFLYLGTKNNTEMYGEFAKLDKEGFIITDENLKMNVEGMYAAGDIRSGVVRQVTVATAEGTKVALEVMKRVLKK